MQQSKIWICVSAGLCKHMGLQDIKHLCWGDAHSCGQSKLTTRLTCIGLDVCERCCQHLWQCCISREETAIPTYRQTYRQTDRQTASQTDRTLGTSVISTGTSMRKSAWFWMLTYSRRGRRSSLRMPTSTCCRLACAAETSARHLSQSHHHIIMCQSCAYSYSPRRTQRWVKTGTNHHHLIREFLAEHLKSTRRIRTTHLIQQPDSHTSSHSFLVSKTTASHTRRSLQRLW